jgi:4-hydroxybenzoate polyprenyltransferase
MRSGSGSISRMRTGVDLGPRAAPHPAAARAASPARLVRRYLSCLRWREILVLQGSPLLGAAFAMSAVTAGNVAALAVMTAASCCLVAHIFVLNDWAGMSADLLDPNKQAGVFAARGIGRREVGGLWLALLVASLALFGWLGPRPLAIALAIAGSSALYSVPAYHAKGIPLLNSALHLAGGILHFLLGYSLFSAIDRRGLEIACFFALVFVAGHLTQEVRDHEGDRLNGIKTNAVMFGKTTTFAAGLAVFTCAYAYLVVLAARAIVPRPLVALAILYPLHLYWSLATLHSGLTFASIRRLQARYRALYAIIGIAMLAALLLAS